MDAERESRSTTPANIEFEDFAFKELSDLVASMEPTGAPHNADTSGLGLANALLFKEKEVDEQALAPLEEDEEEAKEEEYLEEGEKLDEDAQGGESEEGAAAAASGEEGQGDKDEALAAVDEAEDKDDMETPDQAETEAFRKLTSHARQSAADLPVIEELPALDVKAFERRKTVAPKKRMSVADMKGALARFSALPQAAQKQAQKQRSKDLALPDGFAYKMQGYKLISALFSLQSQHRRVAAMDIAHYFTLWRQTVFTVVDDTSILEAGDSDEEKRKETDSNIGSPIAPAPPAPPTEPDTPGSPRAPESFWKDTWTEKATPDAADRAPQTPPRSPMSPLRQLRSGSNANTPVSTPKSQCSSQSGWTKQLQVNAELQAKIELIQSKVLGEAQLPHLKLLGARHTLLIYMKQSLRRKMENGFHHWLWVCRTSKDVKTLTWKSIVLVQEQQSLHAKEFKINSLLNHNSKLNNAIRCSHAFFRWKIWSIQETYHIESRRAEQYRRSIHTSLLELKASLLQRITDSKQELSDKLALGHALQDTFIRVQAIVTEATSLTASINDTCEGGMEVPLPTLTAPKRGWRLVREMLGVDKEAAAKLDKVLGKLTAKQQSEAGTKK